MNRRHVLALLLLIAAHLARAAPLSAAVQLDPFVVGLSSPLFLTTARDGTDRRFIVQQGGIIKVLQPGSSTPTTFLDITGLVLSGGERGLLGLAFHPRYAVNGRFFVNYTRKPDGATVIAEYHVSSDPNVASTAATILLTVAQPFANHNGGMIEFGPDNLLYIGMGDGGSGNDPDNRAQNVNDLLGKILRIDVDTPNPPALYSSPPDNPFFGSTAGRDEIYAFGLRNPWKFSFDRGTGMLIAADVGQGAWEEIDVIVRGGNYGWRIFEGTHCTDIDPCTSTGLISPVLEYGHTGGRCSVTGGYVYRGVRSTLPAGTYVYGDFCSGEIFTLDGGGSALMFDTALSISSFGEDEAGELYVVNLGGTVQRLTSSPPPPACAYSISPGAQAFDNAGGAGEFAFTTTGDCGWMAASHASWITLTSAARGAGGTTVSYTVDAKSTGGSRTGTIAIGGRTFTVVQGVGCTFALSPTNQEFGGSGGAGGVDISTAAGCDWTATSPASWVTFTSATGGSGPGRVTYSVGTNTTRRTRTADLTIAGLTFKVTQDIPSSRCTYSISPTKRNIGASGGTGTVSVKTTTGCGWSVQNSAGWVTITSGGGGGTGAGTVTYSVAPNTTGASRKTNLTIAGKTFSINQSR